MKVRIELTNEIVKAITMNCPLIDSCEDSSKCFERCALAGACMEYYMDDSSQNQDNEKEEEE